MNLQIKFSFQEQFDWRNRFQKSHETVPLSSSLAYLTTVYCIQHHYIIYTVWDPLGLCIHNVHVVCISTLFQDIGIYSKGVTFRDGDHIWDICTYIHGLYVLQQYFWWLAYYCIYSEHYLHICGSFSPLWGVGGGLELTLLETCQLQQWWPWCDALPDITSIFTLTFTLLAAVSLNCMLAPQIDPCISVLAAPLPHWN